MLQYQPSVLCQLRPVAGVEQRPEVGDLAGELVVAEQRGARSAAGAVQAEKMSIWSLPT